jgi:formamidopyrimidine-DNA glycosylase
MPELPEVETVRRGLAPILAGSRILGARVRESRLRWPVPGELDQQLHDRVLRAIDRRGKYLLFRLDNDITLIAHLGMSGSLRVLAEDTPRRKHDHVDILFDSGRVLRFHDPRRFGAILLSEAPEHHPLIADLGLEPLDPCFDGPWLHALTRGRQAPIKTVLMNAHLLVGVGNIYANESLFHAGIHPAARARDLSKPRCARLAESVRATLERAILAGGSTLRDFVDGQGRPGYFQQTYFVYGRADEPCRTCGAPIKVTRQGNRATFFCPSCQKR